MHHLGAWEPAPLVSGSVDLTQCSWREARALIEERNRQTLIGSLPTAEERNALVMSEILLSIDDYEAKALERRREIDAEQRHEEALRLGESASGVAPVSAEPPSAVDAGAIAAPLNLPQPRSYDDSDL